MNHIEQAARDIHEEKMKQVRAKNWAAIVAMGL